MKKPATSLPKKEILVTDCVQAEAWGGGTPFWGAAVLGSGHDNFAFAMGLVIDADRRGSGPSLAELGIHGRNGAEDRGHTHPGIVDHVERNDLGLVRVVVHAIGRLAETQGGDIGRPLVGQLEHRLVAKDQIGLAHITQAHHSDLRQRVYQRQREISLAIQHEVGMFDLSHRAIRAQLCINEHDLVTEHVAQAHQLEAVIESGQADK